MSIKYYCFVNLTLTGLKLKVHMRFVLFFIVWIAINAVVARIQNKSIYKALFVLNGVLLLAGLGAVMYSQMFHTELMGNVGEMPQMFGLGMWIAIAGLLGMASGFISKKFVKIS